MLDFYKKTLLALVSIAMIGVGLYGLRLAFAGSLHIPEGYTVGPLTIRFYSLTLLVGVLVGYAVASARRKQYGISRSDLDNLIVVCIVAGLIGARIHHVLTQWDFYRQNLWAVLYVWRGGLGIYGGIVGGVVAVYVYSRIKKIGFLRVADLLAPSLVIGQAIGRWGNFFNQEAYGLPTDVPWKLYIDPAYRLPGLEQFIFFHPLFLYESLWDIVVAMLLLKAIKTNGSAPGVLFGWYLILYSLGRFIIEGLRADMTLLWGLPLNQMIALIAIGAGLVIVVRARYSAQRLAPLSSDML